MIPRIHRIYNIAIFLSSTNGSGLVQDAENSTLNNLIV